MARLAFVNERMLRGFGVDLQIHSLASELVARGHDVTVYASNVDDSYQPRPYKLDRIPTQATSLFPLYESRSKVWAGYIDAGEHDVVFVHSFPFFRLIPRLRTPTVVIDAGVSPTEGMSPYARANFAYLRYTQQRRYFPKADGLVTISQFVRSRLPKNLQDNASVVYCGVDHYGVASAATREAKRRELGIEDHQRALLYVGRLNPEGQPYKGTRNIMDFASKWREEAPNLRVIMAGHGDQTDADAIRAAGAIPLLATPHEEMAALYSAADVYLTASRWEGFDLPIMEAASQGVPTVALDIGAHPEIVRNGETGILVSNVNQLKDEARRLAEDDSRRRTIADAARAHSCNFGWSRAADGYEEVLARILRAATSPVAQLSPGDSVGPAAAPQPDGQAPSDGTTRVTAIILNYGARVEVLRKCVDSLYKQTQQAHVMIVDNKSVKNVDSLDTLQCEFPTMQILRLDKNYGFAGGMNRGIAEATTEFVLLLNNDVTLAPDAVEEMTRVMETGDDVVGVAPKIMLESDPEYFDAMGNLIDSTGVAFNMGIGQLDIGQYDRIEKTFGACFAATLLRRKSFEEGLVGPLDERFFMYYEDVDWCFRAGVLGLYFLTAPKALVYHAHSLTTRQLAYSFKYRLIMRNFLWTVARNFYRGRGIRVFMRTTLALVRGCIVGPYRVASFRALIGGFFGLPIYILARSNVQNRRRTQDQQLFDYSHGERPYFNPRTYRPLKRLDALEAAYRRLALMSGEQKHVRIADGLHHLASSRLRFDADFVHNWTQEALQDEPPAVHAFLEEIEV
jgi:GT2 family glycosyltransferase/glycosyltransferase involved in cell wall biosynthesis